MLEQTEHLTRQPFPRVPRSASAMANRDLHLPHVMYVSGRGRPPLLGGELSSLPSAPIVTEEVDDEDRSLILRP